jgi:hypothetical protein
MPGIEIPFTSDASGIKKKWISYITVSFFYMGFNHIYKNQSLYSN